MFRHLLRSRQIPVIDPLAAIRVRAAILIPIDRELAPQRARGHEQPDVEPHPIVEIRLPADGLLVQWLPAHLNVVGRLAFQDGDQLLL